MGKAIEKCVKAKQCVKNICFSFQCDAEKSGPNEKKEMNKNSNSKKHQTMAEAESEIERVSALPSRI